MLTCSVLDGWHASCWRVGTLHAVVETSCVSSFLHFFIQHSGRCVSFAPCTPPSRVFVVHSQPLPVLWRGWTLLPRRNHNQPASFACTASPPPHFLHTSGIWFNSVWCQDLWMFSLHSSIIWCLCFQRFCVCAPVPRTSAPWYGGCH